MKFEKIDLITSQLVSIGLIVALPFLASAGISALVRQNAVPDPDHTLSIALCLICVLSVGGLLLVIATRRSICLTQDRLTIKHSFYTFEIEVIRARSAEIRSVQHRPELNIAIKRNGVAAFGFYSGWFTTESGTACFCAVSTLPVYFLHFPDNVRCPVIAISCTADMAEAMHQWTRS